MAKPFDVFLSHNSHDKPAVIALAKRLKAQGLNVWLDAWELRPGHPWQEALEQIIETTKTAAVLVGKDGLGPWEDVEMRACLGEFVKRKLPIVPVLLPDCPTKPALPLLLRAFTWVDMRDGNDEQGFYRLLWGITGEKPKALDDDAPAPKAAAPAEDCPDSGKPGDAGPGRKWTAKVSRPARIRKPKLEPYVPADAGLVEAYAEPSVAALTSAAAPKPEIPNLHGWPAARVQALQREAAQVFGRGGVTFRDSLKAGGEGPLMAVIPAGSFLMGSPADEPERYDSEGPQHLVTFARPFAIGVHAVTFDDYDRYCEANGKALVNDESWGRGRQPVIRVSWDDAQAYCAWLSAQTGQAYRLPSEAEWEYACRAGTVTPFHWGSTITSAQANYDGRYPYNGGAKGEYRQKTVPVDQFAPNAFGLYQMHGNVWEWCEDAWHDDYANAPMDGSAWLSEGRGRVLRGGSWLNYGRRTRSAYRRRLEADDRYDSIGFRLALGPTGPASKG